MSIKPRPNPHTRHSGESRNPASLDQEEGAAEVALSDRSMFQTFNGLWKGKKGPLVRAIVVRNTNFTADGILDLKDVAELDVETKQLASRTLQIGDIIVERSGGGPKQAVGRVCYFNAAGDLPYSFSNFTSVIRVIDHRRLLPRYVHYYLLHLYKDGYTEGLQHATTGIRNLDFSSYLEARVPKKPMPEQQKIAAVLLKMQRAIATQDRLIAATRDLKQSAMQYLFTHGLRGEPLKETEIGLMPKSWEPSPIRELREFLQYGTSTKCGYVREGRPVIRIPNIVDGRVNTNDIKWAKLTEKEVTRYELASGDVIFIRTNGVIDRVGTCSVFRDELPGALFASYLIRARPNDRLHPEFYQYYSMTDQGRAQLSGRASPAADGKFNINTQTIDSVLLPLPSNLSEQRDIAAALATIDRKLAHHQKKRAALNDLFQTTLHQLMTAQIRVADLDIDTSEVADHFPDVGKMVRKLAIATGNHFVDANKMITAKNPATRRNQIADISKKVGSAKSRTAEKDA
jgi:type I restriction enzyme S subunit